MALQNLDNQRSNICPTAHVPSQKVGSVRDMQSSNFNVENLVSEQVDALAEFRAPSLSGKVAKAGLDESKEKRIELELDAHVSESELEILRGEIIPLVVTDVTEPVAPPDLPNAVVDACNGFQADLGYEILIVGWECQFSVIHDY